MKQNLLLITLIALLATACRKDIPPEPCTDSLNPNCIGYHPCNGVQAVTADFEVWYEIPEYASNFQKKRELLVDSIYPPGELNFKATLNNAIYKWSLGNYKPNPSAQKWNYTLINKITLPNTPQDTSVYGIYNCTLTVTKEANKTCFPNEVSTVTASKKIYIKRPSQFLSSGKFRVLFDGYSDSSTIQILPRTHVNETTTAEFNPESPDFRVFVGFKDTKEDSTLVPPFFYNNYFMNKVIYLDEQENKPYIPFNGIFKVNPIDFSIEGKYDIRNQQDNIITHRFKGRKL